jgi:hypothetical protein
MDFYEQGRRLGLKGKQLHEFAMDERQRQHELEMKRLELQLQREKEEREAKLREKELETQLELAHIQQGQANPDQERQIPKCLKIPRLSRARTRSTPTWQGSSASPRA